jgi:uncharacterized protein DUF1499
MLILVRVTKLAIWARRFGAYALPITVGPIVMLRSSAIDVEAFEIAEGLALLLALLAVLFGLAAFARIWMTGDRGWGRAVAGLLLGLACLGPGAVIAAEYLRYPMASDVTTDLSNPPPLVSSVAVSPPSPALLARIAAAYPTIKTRDYPLDPAQVFGLVAGLVQDRDWQLLRSVMPDDQGGNGQLNAVATTLFGFREEVSIRLAPTADGSAVAMRSVSLSTLHEPGANGSRVAAFLTDLDAKIAQAQNAQPAASDDTTDSSDDSDQPPIPAPPPPSRLGKR